MMRRSRGNMSLELGEAGYLIVSGSCRRSGICAEAWGVGALAVLSSVAQLAAQLGDV
jgi:hypothetical protein